MAPAVTAQWQTDAVDLTVIRGSPSHCCAAEPTDAQLVGALASMLAAKDERAGIVKRQWPHLSAQARRAAPQEQDTAVLQQHITRRLLTWLQASQGDMHQLMARQVRIQLSAHPALVCSL